MGCGFSCGAGGAAGVGSSTWSSRKPPSSWKSSRREGLGWGCSDGWVFFFCWGGGGGGVGVEVVDVYFCGEEHDLQFCGLGFVGETFD